jgi:hypothetical protein
MSFPFGEVLAASQADKVISAMLKRFNVLWRDTTFRVPPTTADGRRNLNCRQRRNECFNRNA